MPEMPTPQNTIVLIPGRLASTRLPGKPLADIAGKPMIVRVWQQAQKAQVGPAFIAAAEPEIAEAARAAGADAVLTDPDLPSGSDRIAQALSRIDAAGQYDFVVNLQGDLPNIDPDAIRRCVKALAETGADIATLAAEITDDDEKTDPNVVKAIAPLKPGQNHTVVATDFVRDLPAASAPPFWHHIGLYVYRREALEKFVTLPVSKREKARRLEQMRALDNDMTIAITAVDSVPLGVDTPSDLEIARTQYVAGT